MADNKMSVPSSGTPLEQTAAGCSAIGPDPAEKHDDQDWQFSPTEFERISEAVGGFTLDAACDATGANRLVNQFCSAEDSFLDRSLAGERIWANFPFRHMEQFLLHYHAQKESDPSIMGCFVVPTWKRAPWWPLVENFKVLARYPAGTELFTAPGLAGVRRSRGPTRWPVEVLYDPNDTGLGEIPVVRPPATRCCQPVLAGRAERKSSYLAEAHAWRVVVKSAGGESGTDESDLESASPLPNLLHARGVVGRAQGTIFLDAGAQLNLIGTEFAKKCGFVIEAPQLSIGFPDGRSAALDGLVRNVRIRIGTYVVTLDLHVFDLQGRFDVLLGKGWHDSADPVISWRHNLVQIREKDKWHRFSAAASPVRAFEKGTEPEVCLLGAKAFRKAAKKADCFLGTIQCTATAGKVAAVAAATVDARNQFQKVLDKHSVVFESLPPGLPPEREVPHRIELQPGTKPTSRAPYRFSKFEEEECARQLKQYLSMQHIQPSKSPWGAPVLFARKKNGGLRFCVDYRALNDATVKDKFPIPRVDDLLDRLHGSTVFSKLDLAQGYHQVRIAPEDVYKTAFTTPFGHYEFRVMPFGLCNAPATFQRLMNSTLRMHLGKFCMVYLDDIIVYSRSAKQHERHLDCVLEALADAGFKTQKSKCEFGLQEIEFLGHVVSAHGIKMDSGKLQAMQDWPVPASVKDVRGFLGLLNYYRRFIDHFAEKALPLTELTKETERSFQWTDVEQKAFELLKSSMQTAPVLVLPDFAKPFCVHTDASAFACGAVLEQKQTDGQYHPVAFFSRKFNPAQRNYHTRDREALGIVLALQEWRCYLQGTHFVVNNDHCTLQRLQTQAHLSSRHARWAEFLQEFDCTIQYVKGEDNGAADAFSRRPDLFAIQATHINLQEQFLIELKEACRSDVYLSFLRKEGKLDALLIEDNGLFTHRFGSLYIPLAMRKQLILETHRAAYSGHFGVDRTCARLQQDFWWPRMRQSVAAVLKCCHECQVVNPRGKAKFGLLKPLEIPEFTWEQLTLDLITGLPKSREGHDSCVVFVDRLSKMVHYVPCNKTVDAPSMASLLVNNVVRLHGWPKVVISDRDPRFDSNFWSAVLKGSGTTLKMSTTYHPQTDGQTERANRTLLAMLRKFAGSAKGDWESQLPWLEFSYNNSEQSSTGHTPFFLCTGRNPHVPLKNLVHRSCPAVPCDSPQGKAFQQRLDSALAIAKTNLSLAQARQKFFADSTRRAAQFKEGDEVLLDSSILHFPELEKHKLCEKWYGPLKVISANAETLKLRTPLDKNFFARVHVCACKRYYRDGEKTLQMPHSQIDSDHWEIKAIVGHRWLSKPRRKQFRVRYAFPPHDTPSSDEWFDAADLNAKRLLKEYTTLIKAGTKFVDGVPCAEHAQQE